MTDEEQEIMIDAFFDELSHIEKTAMLQRSAEGELEKEAAGLLGQVVGGFRRLGQKGIGRGIQRAGRAYDVGAARAAKGGNSAFMGGMRSALRTREGKALAVGGAGVLGGAALLGAGANQMTQRRGY